MNTNDKTDNLLDEVLKEAYKKVKPPDSWQLLRTRIDQRINSQESISTLTYGLAKRIIFWRRLAFGMAASFLLASGVLIYFLVSSYGIPEYWRQPKETLSKNLLSQADVDRLYLAFLQVRELFGQRSRWILIGSSNNTQIGVAEKTATGTAEANIVVVRLAVNLDSEEVSGKYFDIITFANQQADLQLSLGGARTIDVSIKPILGKDGTIELDVYAQLDESSRAHNVSKVTGKKFTSLVRMWANGCWVNIEGVGQPVSSI